MTFNWMCSPEMVYTGPAACWRSFSGFSNKACKVKQVQTGRLSQHLDSLLFFL